MGGGGAGGEDGDGGCVVFQEKRAQEVRRNKELREALTA